MLYALMVMSPEGFPDFTRSDRATLDLRFMGPRSRQQVRRGRRVLVYEQRHSAWIGVLDILDVSAQLRNDASMRLSVLKQAWMPPDRGVSMRDPYYPLGLTRKPRAERGRVPFPPYFRKGPPVLAEFPARAGAFLHSVLVGRGVD
jgi:hypothetical protein